MTENGWPPDTNKVVAISLNDCELVTINGTGGQLKLWFQKGIPAIMLPALMADLNEYVESANNVRGYTDEGSWTNGNSVKSSNHNGATAFDYNWDDHPMGEALAGWHGSDIIPGEQEPEIRRILKFYTYKGIQLVWWANDWDSPKDSMHFQMGYHTYENQLICWEFINKFIRADGYSTYRRGGTGRGGDVSLPETPDANAAALLADAMGNVPGVDYVKLAPYVAAALQKSDCKNNNRIAMWCAQIGHESVGLKYMKEIGDDAYFAKYNNRSDLGNGPTDGPRYPGRGPIQVTGRSNYRRLSKWAYGEGYVPSDTFFEDHPEELERYDYAFLGAVWYWTVAQPKCNELSDAGDVDRVSKLINMPANVNNPNIQANGAPDRRNRWNHCKTMDLMPLLSGGEDDWLNMPSNQEKLDFLYAEAQKRGPSRAGVAEDGKDIETQLGYIYNIDGNVWDSRVLGLAYLLDVPYAVEQVERIASDGVAEESWAEDNPFVKSFTEDLAKALVEFKPLFKSVLGLDNSVVPVRKATSKKSKHAAAQGTK